jgi:tRNA modification GTPase
MLAALISPTGRGAIAVLHVSGEGAAGLVERLMARRLTTSPAAGMLTHDGERLDEVMARLAPGFTGEETVEITCHGGTVVVDRILRALAALGAVTADPEILLERGVERGHLDRIRAEAWGLLPRASTELAALVLQDQVEGALSAAVKKIASIRDAERLLATAPLGLALASPRRVVLAGSPNVGKSTLFNALVREDRALVSPLPGTTRDPVRETIAIDQVPVELVDTAGVEAPQDLLEQLSIERTHKWLGDADIILFLFDAEAGAQGPELRFLETLSHRRVILLVNKVDVGRKKPLLDALPISAKTGQGLDDVRRKILRALAVHPRHVPGDAVVFTPRQERLLGRAATGRMDLEECRGELFLGA